MRVIYNEIIPFKGFRLMNILGLLFSRVPEREIGVKSLRHEGTHTLQQYELLVLSAFVSLALSNIYQSWWYMLGVLIFPFLTYGIFFLLELAAPPYHNVKECLAGKSWREKIKALPKFLGRVWMDAYRDNCFEREARYAADHPDYNSTRHLVGFVYFIIKDRKNA